MSCPFENDILRLDDKELSTARRLLVEAHLGSCEHCARKEETLDRVEQALRSGAATPLGVVEAALDSLPERPRAPVLRAVLAGAGALAAGVLILLALSERDDRPAGSPPETHADLPVEPELPGSPQPEQSSQPSQSSRSPESGAPALLPPPASTGAPLRKLVEQVGDDEAAVARLGETVARRGAAGSSALARLLRSRDPELVERALAVARRAPSPRLAASLSDLLEQERFARPAARLLGVVGGRAEVPALVRALDGPARVEAREALVALKRTDEIEERARSRPTAGWLDALVRSDAGRAAELLLDLVPDKSRETLIRDLLDARRGELLIHLRRSLRKDRVSTACVVLGWARDEGSVDELVTLAGKFPTAKTATRALLSIGSPAALRGAFGAYLGGRDRAAAATGFDDARAAEPFLLRVFETGGRRERQAALELLARCGGPRTIDALSRARIDRRLAPLAIRALGATGEAAAVPLLRERSRDRRLAPDVCRALGGIDSTESAELLVDLLDDPRAHRHAAAALVRLPAATVVPVLLRQLEESRRPGRVRHVLASLAGADLGPGLETWKNWWESRAS